jgi:phospholipid/cholesterol/gamma-HCH transport system ATP-binding protein
MLDKEARGVIAEGDPRDLQEHADNPRVHNFFNREPARKKERKV